MFEKLGTDPEGQLSKGEQRIARWLKYLIDPGTVVELRAPEVDTGNGFKITFAGFFDTDHLIDMAVAADTLSTQAAGVYFTLNPVEPELLGLYRNRVERKPPRPVPIPTSFTAPASWWTSTPSATASPPDARAPATCRPPTRRRPRHTRPPSESGPTSPPPAGPNPSPSTAATASTCCTRWTSRSKMMA